MPAASAQVTGPVLAPGRGKIRKQERIGAEFMLRGDTEPDPVTQGFKMITVIHGGNTASSGSAHRLFPAEKKGPSGQNRPGRGLLHCMGTVGSGRSELRTLEIGIGGNAYFSDGLTRTHQACHDNKALLAGLTIGTGTGGQGEDLIRRVHIHGKVMQTAGLGLIDDILQAGSTRVADDIVEGFLGIEHRKDLPGHLLRLGGVVDIGSALAEVQVVEAGQLTRT